MQQFFQKNLTNNYIHTINQNMSQHFIFNTLNSINSFIIDNNAKVATDYISKFGKLLRMLIDNNNNKIITLASELEALELYILMEKMRYQNIFELEINVAENIDTKYVKVPALLLQPYVENLIWQNISNNAVMQKIILTIQLKGKDSLQYIITDKKSNIKPKLFQAPLPHQTNAKLKQTKEWTKQNTSLFDIEFIDLYNNANVVHAQKIIITIPVS